MHIDRLLTLYLFAPLRRISRTDKTVGIPILMYHSISNDDEKDIHPYFQLCTSPEVFATHMQYIRENNYSVISLTEAVKLLSTTQQLNNSTTQPLKCVVITFDDGYRDFYTHAFPILKQYAFPCTVFLPTGLIGDQRPGLKGKEHMNWDEVRALSKEGIRFGSHTVMHPQLTLLKKDDISYELKHSKETIEDNLGQAVESFSYPFAFPEVNKKFKALFVRIIEGCGYKNGVSTRIGIATYDEDKYFLKRIPINTHDDNLLFRAKLEGSYDWLNKLQYIFKKLKSISFAGRHINYNVSDKK